MSEAIRQHIAQLREVIEKRYADNLNELASLERSLLGLPETVAIKPDLALPAGHAPSTHAPADNGHSTRTYGSKAEKVYSAISGAFKTADDLATELKMPIAQIRAALYSKRAKRIVAKKEIGNVIAFKLKGNAIPTTVKNHSQPPSTASLAIDLLQSHKDGLTASEIASHLLDRISSNAANKRNTISSALYNLRKAGKLAFDEATGKYAISALTAAQAH